MSALAGTPAAAAGRPYLDFGARLYDPRTAAWLAPDPLSEKYYGISPYVYCAGNPVNAEDLILGNPSLTGRLLSRDSQLPGFAKADLLAATIHRGQNDFLTHPVTQRTIDALSLFFCATDFVELFAKNIIAKSSLTFDNLIYMAKTYGGKVIDSGDRLFFNYKGREVGTHLSTSMKVQTLDIPLGGPTGKRSFKIRYMP